MGADDRPRSVTAARDGCAWRIGSSAEVAWIQHGTSTTTALTAAIPPVFDAYATVELPRPQSDAQGLWSDEQRRHDRALLGLLSRHAAPQPWWLGYLDTGADDVVFPDAPSVALYEDWRYVLVEAAPQQAAAWRSESGRSFWKGALPNLMFPADRAWLVSTLWDDDWTCVGGPAALVDDLLRDPELGPRTRRVVSKTTPRRQATQRGDRATEQLGRVRRRARRRAASTGCRRPRPHPRRGCPARRGA